MTKRTYLDPIHQDIILDRSKPAERLVMDLIDTQEFQRLRRVHQLGASFFTFQGAEGSRFTHSVGVMYVASKLVDLLRDRSPKIEEKRPLILSAALLHDIGHGPYSHVTEKILDYDHEDWSCKIIGGNTDVKRVLEAFDKDLAKDVVAVLKKTYHPKYISHMVSSQLDCDRFDYLLRDSYMTGTAYGLFALHRILASMELDEENERIIVVGDKGQTAVEDYLFARYSMYAQVYYHRKNLAARCLLAKLVKRARYLMEAGTPPCFMDEATERWLKGEELTVAEYLTLDDVQMTYHIKRWSKDSDAILADLASRFINRRLFKAMKIFRPRSLPPDSREAVASLAETFGGRSEATLATTQLRRSSDKITIYATAKANAIEKRARAICAEAGMDPDYYIDTEFTGIRPYDYYRPEAELPQTNIVVKTDSGEVDELSNLSLAVEALVKGNYETKWLIYPAELSDKIGNLNDLEL
ncbi:MAG TPA: HD domain-containing protein [Oculatellaceae cyanobacterium]